MSMHNKNLRFWYWKKILKIGRLPKSCIRGELESCRLRYNRLHFWRLISRDSMRNLNLWRRIRRYLRIS